ncbi:metallophosphoesterase family protein [Leucobacter sp. CSA2]|uniref:Metallophosphoesterase family protein n=1 Tax=Leucobacter edaphi TaxID=2796472 RepID=A0A934QDT7_9MICO|nr:metallophosphoesterase family protein [Leucobacter edaphi]
MIWINGHRVAGFDDGRVTGTRNLEYAGEAHAAPQTSAFTAPGSVLKDGTNTIAVALHQDREASSDAYFDLSSLTTSTAPPPAVAAGNTPGSAPAGQTPATSAALPERVILNPTATPATSQTFSWIAGDAAQETGEIEIGEAAGGATRTVPAQPAGRVNANPKQHFSVTVDGLRAGTEYRYRVGAPGSTSEWARFTTATAGASDFQFLAFGDAQIGLDTVWPDVIRRAEERAPQAKLSLHVGDLINTATNEKEWNSWFAGLKNVAASRNILTTPGNHEHSGDTRLGTWKANFAHPANQPTGTTIGELGRLAEGESDAAKQWAAYFEHWSKMAADTVYATDYQGVRFVTLNSNRNTASLTPDNLPGCFGLDCPSVDVSASWLRFEAAWLDTVLQQNPGK